MSLDTIPCTFPIYVLRAAPMIDFFNLFVTALGGDDDLSEVMRPVISPTTKLGLMHNFFGELMHPLLSSFLRRPDTIQCLGSHCSFINGDNPPINISPHPFRPLLHYANVSFTVTESVKKWFIETLSIVLSPVSAPTLPEIIISYRPKNVFCDPPPFHLGEAVLRTLNSALMAHPGCPSIRWRHRTSEPIKFITSWLPVSDEATCSSFAASVRDGMPLYIFIWFNL
ncbi:hypothetical protein B0H19DRAFT_1271871 [Mycena capillaripes]|nr:hypothetical protein B0H19DRAFT_1271871 [Mycena capillaripes]